MPRDVDGTVIEEDVGPRSPELVLRAPSTGELEHREGRSDREYVCFPVASGARLVLAPVGCRQAPPLLSADCAPDPTVGGSAGCNVIDRPPIVIDAQPRTGQCAVVCNLIRICHLTAAYQGRDQRSGSARVARSGSLSVRAPVDPVRPASSFPSDSPRPLRRHCCGGAGNPTTCGDRLTIHDDATSPVVGSIDSSRSPGWCLFRRSAERGSVNHGPA